MALPQDTPGSWLHRVSVGDRTNAAAVANTDPVGTEYAIVVRVAGAIGTKTALTASSPTATSVGVSSAQAVASNANRKGLVLVNTSNNTISLAFGATAVLNSGITLISGSSWEMNEYTFHIGAVNAIADVASSNLAVQEYTT